MRITGAGFVPRGAPVTNLKSHLGRGFFALPHSLTKPPFFGTMVEYMFLSSLKLDKMTWKILNFQRKREKTATSGS